MSLEKVVPWLLALQAATIIGMMLSVGADLTAVTALLATAFVVGAIAAYVRANAPYWRGDDPAAAPEIAMRRNTRLAALTYAWAALAMQGVYTPPLTGLRWHHGWQYALIFALLAFGSFVYARALGPRPRPSEQPGLMQWAPPLGAAQGLIAAGGLAYLAGSGKLLQHRADWAANIIFMAAALAIMVLCAITLRTHAALLRRGP